jgi:phosphate transport system substrate-binding protein
VRNIQNFYFKIFLGDLRVSVVNIFLPFFALLILGLISSGCGQTTKKTTITLAGSTSIQPFAERLAEEYMIKNPDVQIDVQGGGSTAGIEAVRAEICDIGMSSRQLREGEEDLNRIVIARDGIAIIVHPANRITNLGLDEVRGIFAGQISNWQEVGGSDHPIYPVTREEGSGTRGAFSELVMKEARISLGASVQNTNGAVREMVASSPFFIGYISQGLVNDQVKALRIDPKTSPLFRPFLFLTTQPPQGVVKDFIDFVLSPQGQEILEEEGLLPAL